MIVGRQLLLALEDVACGVFGECALRLTMLDVLAAVWLDDREMGPFARLVDLVADQVLLALLPLAERNANRARERDVERDAKLDRLAAARSELARGNDRVFRSRRGNDDRPVVLVDDERRKDASPFNRHVLGELEPGTRT